MENLLQTGCLGLGILCFFYYIFILLYAGFRTSISVIWILGGIFFLLLRHGLRYQSVHPQSWVRYAVAFMALILAVGVIVLAVIGSRIIRGMAQEPENGLPYVVVLGAQVKGTAPSRALRRRLERAIAYGKENPETRFILSGGQGPDEGISEAECMFRYMADRGIESTRLLLEDQSTSTAENLRYSDALYHLKDKKVGILSNNFHIYRALLLAKREGYGNAEGIPASADLLMQPHNVLREVCCILAENLFS